LISTVTFDFWQTLLADTPENLERSARLRIEGIEAVLSQSGHPMPAAKLEAAHAAAGQALGEVWREHRDVSAKEQVRFFLDALSPGQASRLSDAEFERVVEAYITPVLHFPPLPSPGALEAVKDLAGRGIRLCVISNTGRSPGLVLRKVLDRYGLLSHFTVLTYSDEIGYRKPHPQIFHETLRLAGSEPAQSVHVGDNPVDDVAGAKAVGMRAIHFSPGGAVSYFSRPDGVALHLDQLPELIRAL
jgi:putative hydrolase of the HAD superfamily